MLEVMVALAILGLALTAVSRSQQLSIKAANHAKLMTVATMLARYKMVEVEDKLFEEGFSDFKKEETGDFKKEGFDRFTWELVVDKVELPASNPEALASSLGGMLGGGGDDQTSKDDKSPEGKMSTMMTAGAKMIGQQFEMIRNTLEQSIRRASLKIAWKEGKRQKEVTVVGYFTDPRKIDAAMGGLGALGAAGAAGAAGTGATGTGAGSGAGRTTGTGTGTTPLGVPRSPGLTPTLTTPGGTR